MTISIAPVTSLNIGEIFAGINLALNKPAVQRDTWTSAVASMAVDGHYDTGSCTLTGVNTWWAVDLGTTHNIGHVVVTNDDGLGRYGDFMKRLEQLFVSKLRS